MPIGLLSETRGNKEEEEENGDPLKWGRVPILRPRIPVSRENEDPRVWLTVFPGVSVWQTIITEIWGSLAWLTISPRVSMGTLCMADLQ